MMQTVNVRRGFYDVWDLFEMIQTETPNQAWIAGGYAAYMGSAAPCPPVPGDIDIFPRNQESWGKLFDALMKHNEEYLRESRRAVTFTVDDRQVQLIHPFEATESPEKLVEDFDFTVCRAVLVNENCVLVDDEFEADTQNMKLRFKNIKNPMGALVRLTKYARKGYDASPAELAKILQCFNYGPPRARQNLLRDFGEMDDAQWDIIRDEEEFIGDDDWDDYGY